MNQYQLPEREALQRPTVRKLQEQLDRLEQEKHDAAVRKQEEIIATDLRRRIKALGAEPCA